MAIDAAAHRRPETPSADKGTVYRGCWGMDGRIAYRENNGSARAAIVDRDAIPLIGWGAESEGCELLARAILQDATGSPTLAASHGPRLAELLARFPSEGFALSRREVLDWLGANGVARDAEP
jgi:hypothetical protein